MRILCALLIVIGLASVASGQDPRPRFLYAANLRSDDVSAWRVGGDGGLSPVGGSPFAAGRKPSAVCVEPLGRYAYVANATSSDISAYAVGQDGALRSIGTFPTAASPQALAADPAGRCLYVANGLQADMVSVYAIDGGSGRLQDIGQAQLAQRTVPNALAMSRDGALLAATGYSAGNVTIFQRASDTGLLRQNGQLATSVFPQAAAFHGNGRWLYTCGSSSDGISAFDAQTLKGLPGSPFRAGPQPSCVGVAMGFAWVGDFSTGDLIGYAVDASSGALTPLPGYPINGGRSVRALVADPTGRFVFTADSVGSTVAAWRVNNGMLTAIGSPKPADDGPVSLDVLIR